MGVTNYTADIKSHTLLSTREGYMLPNLTPFNTLCVSTANKRCNKVSKHTYARYCLELNSTTAWH